MDLWLQGPLTKTQEPGVKNQEPEAKKARGEMSDPDKELKFNKEMLGAILDMGDLTIQTCRGQAQLEGVLFSTWKVSKTDKMVQDVQGTGKW